MKKAFCMILALLTCFGCCTALASCAGKHVFSEEWSADATHHWHICTEEGCTEQSDKAEHIFDDGVMTLLPTQSTPGVRKYTCEVCGGFKTEAVEAEPTVDNVEWADAFLLQEENFTMTVVNSEGTLLVKKRDGIVMTTTPQTVSLHQNYYTVEGGKYYCYTVNGEQVTKAEITQVAYQSVTTLADLQGLAYADFTYSESGLVYTAAQASVGDVVCENVYIYFADKRITNMSFTKKETGQASDPIVITITYGTVAEVLVLPQVTDQ